MGIKVTDTIDDINHTCATYVCDVCSTHLLSSSWIIPGEFRGSHGKAYFVNKLLNYVVPKKYEVRKLQTGDFKVKDVKCKQCFTTIGWKYLEASAADQKYKENRYVIEAKLIRKLRTGDSLMSYLTSKSLEGMNVATLKNEKMGHDKVAGFLNQLNSNIHHLDSTAETDWETMQKHLELGKNKFVSVDTVDKIIYKDKSHYFEMKKDLLNNSKYAGHFQYYFSGDYEPEDTTSLLSYQENRGYYYANDDDFDVHEIDDDDDEEEGEDNEQQYSYSDEDTEVHGHYMQSPRIGTANATTPSFASLRFDPNSYYLLQSGTRSYLPRFRSLLRASNAIFNSEDPMSLDNITNEVDNSQPIQVGFGTAARNENLTATTATTTTTTAPSSAQNTAPSGSTGNISSNIHPRNQL